MMMRMCRSWRIDTNIRLFSLSIASIALVPFGAAAQVDAGDYLPLECESAAGRDYTLAGVAPAAFSTAISSLSPRVLSNTRRSPSGDQPGLPS